MDIITSRSNEQIKNLQKLRQKKNRDQEKLIPIEGIKLLLEALKSGNSIVKIFISEKFKNEKIIAQLKNLSSEASPKASIYYLSEFVFSAVSTMKNPEGLIALIEKPKLIRKRYKKYILLEDVQDPTNLGTIIRTADAAGFDAIISSPKTVDFYNEKVLRGSMGSIFHLALIDSTNLFNTILDLKEANVTIIGTALEGTNLFKHQFEDYPLALIMGNESRGMSNGVKELCDYLLKIPILGFAESLNVSMAAGIVLYEIVRQEMKI